MSANIERRTFEASIETREDLDGKLEGHAAVFNEPADIGGMFREVIKPGAFKNAIKRGDDVRALFNHDANFVLGRSVSGTLELKEDKKGLGVSIDPPDTQFARDLNKSISRGDISQMSIAFQVTEEAWKEGEEGELDTREIRDVKLYDVSPVTFPAYEGTDIAVRSWKAYRKNTKDTVTNKRKAKARLRKHQADILQEEN